jgi:thymidylate synthase (FAD)
MLNEEIQVLDHGFVRLDAAEATDLSVVNSARVSFGKRKEEMDEGDQKLVYFLLKNRHGTPFEHNMLRFHVKAPIFVAREWMRHRIGSFNEWSLRYAKVENPDFYLPKEFRTQVGKPGAYTYEKWKGGSQQMLQHQVVTHYRDSVDLYNYMIDREIAREQARLVLPLALFTEFYWTVNARSLMNFIGLRNADAAQWEIREYAKIVEELWTEEMPITANVFISNGRVAP